MCNSTVSVLPCACPSDCTPLHCNRDCTGVFVCVGARLNQSIRRTKECFFLSCTSFPSLIRTHSVNQAWFPNTITCKVLCLGVIGLARTVFLKRLASLASLRPQPGAPSKKRSWLEEDGEMKPGKVKGIKIRKARIKEQHERASLRYWPLLWIHFRNNISKYYKYIFIKSFKQFYNCSCSVLMFSVCINPACARVCVCTSVLCAVIQNSCLSQSHMFPITMTNQLTSHFPHSHLGPPHTCNELQTYMHTDRKARWEMDEALVQKCGTPSVSP